MQNMGYFVPDLDLEWTSLETIKYLMRFVVNSILVIVLSYKEFQTMINPPRLQLEVNIRLIRDNESCRSHRDWIARFLSFLKYFFL